MTAVSEKPRLKIFHATMVVKRLEEWCAEAETPEEARALAGRPARHRCHSADCVYAERATMGALATLFKESVAAETEQRFARRGSARLPSLRSLGRRASPSEKHGRPAPREILRTRLRAERQPTAIPL
jgi:hypothetical protein